MRKKREKHYKKSQMKSVEKRAEGRRRGEKIMATARTHIPA